MRPGLGDEHDHVDCLWRHLRLALFIFHCDDLTISPPDPSGFLLSLLVVVSAMQASALLFGVFYYLGHSPLS
jgi:hypothetical protein